VAMPYGSTPQYQSPSRIGDAGPVGLVAFGITTVMLNFMNAGVRLSMASSRYLCVSIGLVALL
jgi:succinate-acetate transporter protein